MKSSSIISAYSKACRYIINPDKNNTNDPAIKLAARKTWGRSGKLSQNSISSFTIFHYAYQDALKIYSPE
ncbi:hypothetical protein [Piscirickettsia salmonis]|uniref:hypothetical protein n=1 Tax=Piscirickettsia salmonis TaxID=1238 RepID=UPI000332D51E|nr:hypothetical protein [Piscirickettsia salmonis]APS59070.1 hypothetical protein AVI52_17700 [Piscirickettsia salmonis]ERL61868.1 hypothetical protein K661_01776 [Piscirickettsia salmonis LF-89 = ATCC VR-1361]PEQ16270.1 hypothetical protein X973_08310 [Piscirickettsia salmonis]QGN79258.1 hypothetical protein Psal001_03523 [Piscirickettsia salmonis]QGN82849.1 hypothetical protein Psal002_03549 [Piscirickettsia salmonis]